MRTSTLLTLATLLLPVAALADTGPVTATLTPSGSSVGDNRPCEFFQIKNQQMWYAIPMTSLGSNAQVNKIENAAYQYLKNPQSPTAIVTFGVGGPVANCDNWPLADDIIVGEIH